MASVRFGGTGEEVYVCAKVLSWCWLHAEVQGLAEWLRKGRESEAWKRRPRRILNPTQSGAEGNYFVFVRKSLDPSAGRHRGNSSPGPTVVDSEGTKPDRVGSRRRTSEGTGSLLRAGSDLHVLTLGPAAVRPRGSGPRGGTRRPAPGPFFKWTLRRRRHCKQSFGGRSIRPALAPAEFLVGAVIFSSQPPASLGPDRIGGLPLAQSAGRVGPGIG